MIHMDGNKLISIVCMAFIMMSLISLSGKNTVEGANRENPTAVINTNMGPIKVELFQNDAPITVDNFEKYAEAGFYSGLIFHRVMKDFVIQGGGFTPDMKQKETPYGPIKNEAEKSGHRNKRGTIAMARTKEADSATSQFFINLKYNENLDWDNARDGVGYCVFGQVTEGMDVVDSIGSLETETREGIKNVPVQDVIINSVNIEGGSTDPDNGGTDGGTDSEGTSDDSTSASSSASSPFYTNLMFIEAVISVIVAVGIILFLRSREEKEG